MALKARLKPEDHAKLSDTLKAEYTKNTEGIFVLAVEEVDGWQLDDVVGLKTALSAERRRADEANAKLKTDLKAFEGLDPAKARDALKQLEAISAGEPDANTKRKIESLTAQLNEKHRGELEPLQKALETYAKEIDALTVDRAIAEAFGKVTLIPGAAQLLTAHIKSNGLVKRVVGTDGKSVVKVFGEDGQEMVTREAGKNGNATVDELVSTHLKKQFSSHYVESSKSGGGADAGSNRGGNLKQDSNVQGASRLANALAAGS